MFFAHDAKMESSFSHSPKQACLLHRDQFDTLYLFWSQFELFNR